MPERYNLHCVSIGSTSSILHSIHPQAPQLDPGRHDQREVRAGYAFEWTEFIGQAHLSAHTFIAETSRIAANPRQVWRHSSLKKLGSDFRRHECYAVKRLVDCRDQVFCGIDFEHITLNPGLERRLCKLRIVICGQDNHRLAHSLCHEYATRIDATELRHSHIGNCYVRTEHGGHREECGAIACHTDDFEFARK